LNFERLVDVHHITRWANDGSVLLTKFIETIWIPDDKLAPFETIYATPRHVDGVVPFRVAQ